MDNKDNTAVIEEQQQNKEVAVTKKTYKEVISEEEGENRRISNQTKAVVKAVVGELLTSEDNYNTDSQVEGETIQKQMEQQDGNPHELQFAWTMWYVYTLSHREKKKLKRARYNEYVLHEVHSFNNIEDFWRMHNNTYSIQEVISNTDYLIFKKGIRPEWEDPANKEGGKWVVTMPIEDHVEEECEQAWQTIILYAIGGLFTMEQMEIINGLVFSIRDKHLRISLWCAEATNIEMLTDIGKLFKSVAKLPKRYHFGFQVHQKALKHDLDNQNLIQL